MSTSIQDQYYLENEGNDFFRRNFGGKEAPILRPLKKVIFENLTESGIAFSKVLEYGCCYGDLLFYLKANGLATECVGVDASDEAVAFGAKEFGDGAMLVHGTIADNEINKNADYTRHFDLIIIDDVFGWVSRETLLESIANIDVVLADNGHVFIRDFYPDKRVKNQNHHVESGVVCNYKVPGSHASVFLATGTYEVVFQKIYYDTVGMSTGYNCDNNFNYRWTDVVLRKSINGYFNESKKK